MTLEQIWETLTQVYNTLTAIPQSIYAYVVGAVKSVIQTQDFYYMVRDAVSGAMSEATRQITDKIQRQYDVLYSQADRNVNTITTSIETARYSLSGQVQESTSQILQRIDKLETSTNTKIDNLVTTVTQWLEGLAKTIASLVTGLQNFVNSIIEGLESTLGAIIDGITKSFDRLMDRIADKIDAITGKLGDIGTSIRDAADRQIRQAQDSTTAVVAAIRDTSANLIRAQHADLDAIATSISKSIDALTSRFDAGFALIVAAIAASSTPEATAINGLTAAVIGLGAGLTAWLTAQLVDFEGKPEDWIGKLMATTIDAYYKVARNAYDKVPE